MPKQLQVKSLIPDARVLISLPVEIVAFQLLQIARSQLGSNDRFHPDHVIPVEETYGGEKIDEAKLARQCRPRSSLARSRRALELEGSTVTPIRGH